MQPTSCLRRQALGSVRLFRFLGCVGDMPMTPQRGITRPERERGATRVFTRSPAGGILPAVADVGRFLLVARPVGKADRPEASRFVETARASVRLKAPQFEGTDPAFLRCLDQL